MSRHVKTGHFILVLADSTVLSAGKLEATHEGIVASSAPLDSIKTILRPESIKKIWRAQDSALPAHQLEYFCEVGSAILSLEKALDAYHRETGKTPYTSQGPLLFGASSLLFTLSPFRPSQDLDISVTEDFIEWSMSHWNPPLEIGIELATDDLLNLCGKWRERTTILEGLEGMHFRVLHPLDVLSQKLLRRSEQVFQERDAGDIDTIINRLNPSPDTLQALLTESEQRYNPTPHDPIRPRQDEAIARNTNWFLHRYLPHLSVEDLAREAWNKNKQRLDRSGLLPEPPPKAGDTLRLSQTCLEQLGLDA